MTRVQAAQVIARLPVMPVLKQEIKMEKMEMENPIEKDMIINPTQDPSTTATRRQIGHSTSQEMPVIGDDRQPVPSTSRATPTSSIEAQPEENSDVIEEPTGREEDEPKADERSEVFNRYALTGKGRNPEEKIQEACKEINYKNLTVLLAVGDYVVNQIKNIKDVARK